MTLTTPAGRPASSSNFTRYRVVSGVSAAGLITTVHPAASAGAILRVAMARGKFQGVMSSAGPSAWRRSEEHTSELQSLMRNTYAVFCLKKKKKKNNDDTSNHKTTKTE